MLDNGSQTIVDGNGDRFTHEKTGPLLLKVDQGQRSGLNSCCACIPRYNIRLYGRRFAF